ncbi:unnamed protein product, partial [marine sediment metagenome]
MATIPAQHCIETEDNNLLLVAHYLDSAQIHCHRISPKGKLLSVNRLAIEEVAAIVWNNAVLPGFKGIFHYNNSIWFILQGLSFEQPNGLYLIVFDKNGKVVKQKEKLEGQILSIDRMPTDVKRFIELHKGVIYYFGLDNQNNLYFWNSRLGYRAPLFSPFYSVHYDHVK